MTFTTSLAVRFGDEDHARVAYYPRIFHYLHVAFEDFFGAQGIPFRELFDVDHVGFPLARSEADFRAPMRMGDVLEIDVSLLRVGERSATFRYRVRHRGGSEALVEAKLTVACVDIATFKSTVIPARYRALFERHLEVPQGA